MKFVLDLNFANNFQLQHFQVMRLWSLEKYKCVEEYPIPGTLPLIDFDFDESKVTQKRSIYCSFK